MLDVVADRVLAVFRRTTVWHRSVDVRTIQDHSGRARNDATSSGPNRIVFDRA